MTFSFKIMRYIQCSQQFWQGETSIENIDLKTATASQIPINLLCIECLFRSVHFGKKYKTFEFGYN